VLSNSIQQLVLVIRNGRQEVHARTLTSVCKSGITLKIVLHSAVKKWRHAVLSLTFKRLQ